MVRNIRADETLSFKEHESLNVQARQYGSAHTIVQVALPTTARRYPSGISYDIIVPTHVAEQIREGRTHGTFLGYFCTRTHLDSVSDTVFDIRNRRVKPFEFEYTSERPQPSLEVRRKMWDELSQRAQA